MRKLPIPLKGTEILCHALLCFLKPVVCRYVYYRWKHNPKLSRGTVSCRDKMQPTSPSIKAKTSCLLTVIWLLCAGAAPIPYQFASSTLRTRLKKEGLPCLEWLVSTSCSCPSSSGSHSSCRYLHRHCLPGDQGRMKLFRIEEWWPGVEPPMPISNTTCRQVQLALNLPLPPDGDYCPHVGLKP